MTRLDEHRGMTKKQRIAAWLERERRAAVVKTVTERIALRPSADGLILPAPPNWLSNIPQKFSWYYAGGAVRA